MQPFRYIPMNPNLPDPNQPIPNGFLCSSLYEAGTTSESDGYLVLESKEEKRVRPFA